MAKLSPRERELAERAIARQDDKRRKASASRGKQAEAILASFRGRVHGLLGAKKTAEFQDAVARERLAFRGLWDPPAGLGRDYAKEQQASRRRIAQLARKLGADPAKLARITEQFDGELRDVLSAVDAKVTSGFNLAKNYKKWRGLSPFHELPLPWLLGPLEPGDDPTDPTDPYRWFLFKPPFFGFLFNFAPQNTGNFAVDYELALAPAAGLVGSVATMDTTDPGDFAAASITCESQIAFAFVPPIAGIVEVLIDAQCTLDDHSIQITDQFGFSDAWCNQESFLMMNVLHPNVPQPSLAQMSSLDKTSGGGDVSADQELLTPGTHYYADLVSSGPVPAGESVIITAGARSFNIAHANDMELHSKANCQWFINSVEVRISP